MWVSQPVGSVCSAVAVVRFRPLRDRNPCARDRRKHPRLPEAIISRADARLLPGEAATMTGRLEPPRVGWHCASVDCGKGNSRGTRETNTRAVKCVFRRCLRSSYNCARFGAAASTASHFQGAPIALADRTQPFGEPSVHPPRLDQSMMMVAITTYLRFAGLPKDSLHGFLLVCPLALISAAFASRTREFSHALAEIHLRPPIQFAAHP